MRFRSERLSEDHNVDDFASGNDALDDWLKRHAHHAAAMNTGRTFVWHSGEDRVVAYFTLAAHRVRRENVARRAGRGSPIEIPAVLLARLALHTNLHGQGLGGELLWDALTRTVAAGSIAAARLIVVDAIDDNAADFYEHHGFLPSPDDPHLLVQKLSDIARSLGIS
ncbi:MAG: GNAT family N-acetyltransferase [Acidimicrobiales bacterium]|nr:GNAT family N-acetyltransferase [Acidimicrobiales bacterium]